MTLEKIIWYNYKSCEKHNKRLEKKLNSIIDYHLGFMSVGGYWFGKE